ncbi:MAG: NAD(P)H-dependent glycerol-3-phosphate dehydrogenase [Wenzhouxiangella sp.]
MQRRRILILGHGAMGSMFEQLLSAHNQVIWERDPDTDEENVALESACAGREIVLFALPAHPHRELAERLVDCLDEGAVCLSIAKGLDAEGHPPARVFEEVFGARVAWGMLCGPMIADDLAQGRTGFAVLAAPATTARQAAALFADTRLYLDIDDDVHGAGWSVILKNVFVPLIGAADKLELGDNLRGFLVAEAIAELARIVEAMGGRAETARGPAGLGDLVTTATSPTSHHRGIGADLASGRTDKVADDGEFIRSEGVHTIQRVREFELLARGRYPLFDLAGDFLTGELALEKGLERYLARRFRRSE